MSAEFIARTFENTDYSSPGRFIWSHVRRHPLVAFLMVFGAFTNAALASVVPVLVGSAARKMTLGVSGDVPPETSKKRLQGDIAPI